MNPPKHYDLNPEPRAVMLVWNLNYGLDHALKYLARYNLKGDHIGDLNKAIDWIQHHIDNICSDNRYCSFDATGFHQNVFDRNSAGIVDGWKDKISYEISNAIDKIFCYQLERCSGILENDYLQDAIKWIVSEIKKLEEYNENIG